jgi:hypothetical protein
MVNTANNVMDTNPLERMDTLEDINSEKRESIAKKKKELEELEKTKKKEIEEWDWKKRKMLDEMEQKKEKELADLDKKRKELEDMEQKKVKEIEETQELIERSFQDLMRHKRKLLHEEDEDQKKKVNKDVSLEEVANTAPTNLNLIPQGANANYNKFFENLEEPQRLYDITNSQFYSNLTNLRDRASNGDITPEEEMFIARLKGKFEQFNNNDTYIERDQNQYVKRSMNIIEQIGKYHRLKSD